MNKFTDEDLFFLKQECQSVHPTMCRPSTTGESLLALIARLEAAERVIDTKPDHICFAPDCDGCNAQEAWEKVAGK